MLKKILKNNLILIIQMAVNSVSLLILTPHILKNITLEQYGSISATLSASVIINTLITYGTNITGPILASRSETASDDNISIITITSLKLLIFCLSLPVIIFGISSKSHSYEISILIITCTFACALNTNWFLQGKSRFIASAAISCLATVTTTILGLILISKESNNNFLYSILTITTTHLLIATLTFITAARYPLKNITTPKIFNLINENSKIALSQILSSIYTSSGALIIFNLTQKSDAGIYGAISRFYEPIAAACILVHTAALPALSASYKKSKKEYISTINKILIAYFTLTTLLSTFIIIYRSAIASFILSDNNPTAENIIIAFSTLLPLSICGPIITTHYALTDCTNKVLKITTQSLLICIPAGVVGLVTSGPHAWIYALCLSQFYILCKLLFEIKKV